MNISLSKITKDQTNIIKAVGILLIVFHNFLHWTNDIGENEFKLDISRIHHLINYILADPKTFFNAVITYFGHYGVQLFIFISGYGLTKQYSKNTGISYKEYIVPKLMKIYSLLIFGMIVYFILFAHSLTLEYSLSLIVSSLLMYNNFSEYWVFRFIHLGPWWYFSLIVQLYLIFPFLYRLMNKGNNREKTFLILLVVSYLIICLLNPVAERFQVPLFANFEGHLPEFLFGIFLAMSDKFRLSLKMVLPALCIFILSNRFELFFPLSFLSVTILLLALSYFVYTRVKGRTREVLLFIGNISMYMFIINGLVRAFTIPFFKEKDPLFILAGSFLHLILVLVVSYIIQIIFRKFINPNVDKLVRVILKK